MSDTRDKQYALDLDQLKKQGSAERFFAILSRVAVWGLLFLFLYLLRSFFLLLF